MVPMATYAPLKHINMAYRNWKQYTKLLLLSPVYLAFIFCSTQLENKSWLTIFTWEYKITNIVINHTNMTYVIFCFSDVTHTHKIYRTDSRFVPIPWETPLLCNGVSHWMGARLESSMIYMPCSLDYFWSLLQNPISGTSGDVVCCQRWQYGWTVSAIIEISCMLEENISTNYA